MSESIYVILINDQLVKSALTNEIINDRDVFGIYRSRIKEKKIYSIWM